MCRCYASLLLLAMYLKMIAACRAVGSTHFVKPDFNPVALDELEAIDRKHSYQVIENILFIIINLELIQKLNILFAECLLLMMRFLVLYVLIYSINVRLAV